MEENVTKRRREVLPAVALRETVMFPTTTMHFDCSMERSIQAVYEASEQDGLIYLVALRDLDEEAPLAERLYEVGVVAKIKQVVKLKGGLIRVAAQGQYRAKTLEVLQESPCLQVVCAEHPHEEWSDEKENYSEALMRTLRETLEEYCFLAPQLPQDLVINALVDEDPQTVGEYIAQNVPFDPAEKQKLLEESDLKKRTEELLRLLSHEVEVLRLEKEISDRVKERLDQNQKEYCLREQLKIIHQELGDDMDEEEEEDKYQKMLDELELPDEVRKKFQDEINKLKRTPYGSQEGLVSVNYLELALSLPWNKESEDKLDVNAAQTLLDREHYGMKKVKERILESLSVRKLAPNIKGQILCLVGPPGVGKTSVAKSIAEAMGRTYVRMSLGGVRDEAEIRGHRKTYIGAMPGRIISAIKQAGVNNPLILLDEVDKLCSDVKGDPSSALLEVLDSEQNFSFRDHYLEVPFDLSKVVFLATANDAGMIPGPLYDRMEVINLPSYTREEKFHIAKEHLVPKQLKRHGLNKSTARIADDALYETIDGYTREAGVRTLERQISSICRKCAKEIVSGEKKSCRVSGKNLKDFLGPRKFKDDSLDRKHLVGVVNGLAWTSVGGEILQVEVAAVDGSGKLELTGSLGKVMQESAKAAITYVRSVCEQYHIDKDFYKTKDIHIHFPEGAVPKDGPSAGVTITTAIVSALTGMEVRSDVAMTGEVTLRGRVLPIGGLREKTMAAYRHHMKTVLIPQENEPDLYEVDDVVKENIRFVPVSHVSQVLREALIEVQPKKDARKAKAGEAPALNTSSASEKTPIPQQPIEKPSTGGNANEL